MRIDIGTLHDDSEMLRVEYIINVGSRSDVGNCKIMPFNLNGVVLFDMPDAEVHLVRTCSY